MFAILKDKLGNGDIFANDGTVADGAINAEIPIYDYVAVEFKIMGFTDAHKDIEIAMGAYVIATDGESSEYSYIQASKPTEGAKYSFISYGAILEGTRENNL
jgi:hypothetical protein